MKQMEKYQVLTPCSEKCRLNCRNNVDDDTCSATNQCIWSLSFALRRQWLSSFIVATKVAGRKTDKEGKQRSTFLTYSLPDASGYKNKVCKVMFLRTLGIKTDGIITSWKAAKRRSFDDAIIQHIIVLIHL